VHNKKITAAEFMTSSGDWELRVHVAEEAHENSIGQVKAVHFGFHIIGAKDDDYG
jgi:hypothetical protein